jgi:hypothetical protein
LQQRRCCGPARAQLPARRSRGRPALPAQAEAGAARRRRIGGAGMGQLSRRKKRPTRMKMIRPGQDGRNRPRRDAPQTGPARIRPLLAQPGFCCIGPSGIGRDRPRNLLSRPREAKFAACRPAIANSGQEKLYSGRGSYMPTRGMPKSTLDPYMPAGT